MKITDQRTLSRFVPHLIISLHSRARSLSLFPRLNWSDRFLPELKAAIK
ncbi:MULTISPECIES: hypothetical protein [Nostoc]|uniref:Transposase n=1 Tax=Nostoc paludosum FACHB-159 TaxID=2692908 RepID=A0ABR8KN94_9NOSO|nr:MULTISPECIES: hypothetical protein [Nostoc]MBD2683634.1 hypothetical protein [Nostoc sp. FACHB-857]MBD2739959.1 hypothetical protein [Nostoc paludosum FACHB-159]